MRAAEEIHRQLFDRDRQDWARFTGLTASIIDTQCNLAKYRAVVEAAKELVDGWDCRFNLTLTPLQLANLRTALSDLEG